MDMCQDVIYIFYLALFKKIVGIIQIIAPIIAIIAIAIIFIKLLINPDEKKYAKQLRNSIKALIIVFLIPFIVKLSLNLVSSYSSLSWCLEEEEQAAIEKTLLGGEKSKYIDIHQNERKPIIYEPDDYDDAEITQTTTEENAFYFLNLGVSSDCILIQDNGHYGLIDLSYDTKKEELVRQLNKIGVKELDFIIISHAHVDHRGGFSYVLDNFPLKTFYTKKDSTSSSRYSGTYRSYINKAKSKGAHICDVGISECQSFYLGNIHFQLYNTESLIPKNSKAENANSIVAVATVNGRRIYFAGDIGNYYGNNRESQAAEEIGDIDIYKAAHHGYTSFNNHEDALLNLKPEYTIITNNQGVDGSGARRLKKLFPQEKIYYVGNGMITLWVDTDGGINIKQ